MISGNTEHGSTCDGEDEGEEEPGPGRRHQAEVVEQQLLPVGLHQGEGRLRAFPNLTKQIKSRMISFLSS